MDEVTHSSFRGAFHPFKHVSSPSDPSTRRTARMCVHVILRIKVNNSITAFYTGVVTTVIHLGKYHSVTWIPARSVLTEPEKAFLSDDGVEKKPTLGFVILGDFGFFGGVRHAAVCPCPGAVTGTCGFIVADLSGQNAATSQHFSYPGFSLF